MKNYSINIDHENKLISYQHKGEIRHEDIGYAWDDLLKLEEFTIKKYNLLSDYREGKFIANNKDVEHICKILESLHHILNGKKQALIIDTPLNTALSMLFEGEVNMRTGFIVKIFSTKEAAIEWLKK